MIKLLIGVLLLTILYCLGSALYYMLSPKSAPKSMAKALTWRITLFLGVFVLLIVGFLLGWVHPHGL
ncbi:MAG: DUF2909 domain-containing protein [Gammaproteobacteria bacterium]